MTADLTQKTINAHIKHFKLKIKNGFIYKGKTAIYTEQLNNKEKLLQFLEGMSIIYDNKELWNLKEDF